MRTVKPANLNNPSAGPMRRSVWPCGWCAALMACVLMVAPAWAEEIPWRQRSFDLQANNEPLNTFLSRMLTIDGVSAAISPAVAAGRVNGRFKGRAQTVFKELSDTYGLTSYFDGATLHVYGIVEIETRLLYVEPADVPRIDRTLKQMRLFDARFPLRVANGEGQVLVSGPPRYVELVADVVARVAESPTQSPASTEVRVFRLRHASADETIVNIGGMETRIPGMAQTLQSLLGEHSTPSAPSKTLPRTLDGLRGKGQIAVGQRAPGNSSASTNTAASGSAAPQDSGGAAAETAPESRSPTNATASGYPRNSRNQASVRSDPRLNAVVVRDTRERMPMYAELIQSLDVETALMEIEASVIDVSDDKSEQLGIDWRLHSKRADVVSSPNGLAGNGTDPVTNAANDLLFSEGPLSSGRGLIGTLIFGNARSFFLTRVNALAERGDANLVSRPRVLTLDHTEAVLQSTREFFVRVAGKDQVDLFNVTLGLTMRVTPHLVEDSLGRRFKLQIRIEDGNTGTGARVDQIPVVSRNAIATQATVGEGQSLLIGGYVIEQRTESKTGIPFLSEMPIIGALFGQRNTGTRRVERMFLITPRLVTIGADTKAASMQLGMSPSP